VAVRRAALILAFMAVALMLAVGLRPSTARAGTVQTINLTGTPDNPTTSTGAFFTFNDSGLVGMIGAYGCLLRIGVATPTPSSFPACDDPSGTSASYSNLAPGTYTFFTVTAYDSGDLAAGVINGLASYTWTILPPTPPADPTPPAPPAQTPVVASPAGENSTYLCYSKRQDNPGVWTMGVAQRLLDGGTYWKPYAIAGAGIQPAGAYHLVCNLGADEQVTGAVVGNDGMTGPAGVGATTLNWYPVAQTAPLTMRLPNRYLPSPLGVMRVPNRYLPSGQGWPRPHGRQAR